jgi:hypothetical protein
MPASEPVTWRLAPGNLAAGKVNLLVGDEGIGKSLWTIRAMSAITTGKPWGPFTITDDPADVVLIATEDGWADTIRPRLEVADTDLERMHVFSASNDGTGLPTFPDDMDKLRASSVNPSLIVVDAWIDTVYGGLSVKDPQRARQAVAPWKSYAADTNAAVLLVAHTNRGERQNLRNTYGLSGALRQVARSTLYAAEDPESRTLLVGPEKTNLGSKAMAERFDRTPITHFPPTATSDGTVPRLDHVGTDYRTITEALADQSNSEPAERRTTAIDNWVSAALADGPMKSKALEEQAKSQGYSPDQVQRSRERLGVAAKKVGDEWFAALPTSRTQ